MSRMEHVIANNRFTVYNVPKLERGNNSFKTII